MVKFVTRFLWDVILEGKKNQNLLMRVQMVLKSDYNHQDKTLRHSIQ